MWINEPGDQCLLRRLHAKGKDSRLFDAYDNTDNS